MMNLFQCKEAAMYEGVYDCEKGYDQGNDCHELIQNSSTTSQSTKSRTPRSERYKVHY